MLKTLTGLHDTIFGAVERLAGDWFTGLAARFVFLAVLMNYYLSSAATKVGEGFTGFFTIRSGAYYQILTEKGLEAYSYDVANVPFYLDAVVWMGTYAEFVLPVLILIGLFTRIAAAGMIVFVIVQSWVDINLHGVDAKTAGSWFDRFPDGAIMDQRLLWVFVLAMLVVKGAGTVSADRLLSRLANVARASS